MQDAVYKIVELTGSSKTGIEEAIQNAIDKVSRTLVGLRWFEVIETRGHLENNRISSWQVTVKVGCNVDYKAHEEKKEKKTAGEKDKSSEEGSGKTEPGEKGATDKYRCTVCGYVYDPEKGDPDHDIAPGTSFEDLPDTWTCPECGVGKDKFEKIEKGE